MASFRGAFVHSHHQGFPVVENDGKLVGIITQTDLAQTRRRRMPKDTPLYRFMTPQPVAGLFHSTGPIEFWVFPRLDPAGDTGIISYFLVYS